VDNLAGFFGQNTVLRSVWLEICFVWTISASVWTVDGMINDGVVAAAFPALEALKPITLPGMPFTLSAPALGLLLVFRTNTAYSRYAACRNLWGEIIDTCRDLTRQGASKWESQSKKEELARRAIAFSLILKKHSRGGFAEETLLQRELKELLGRAEAERLLKAKHRPTQAIQDLSRLIYSVDMDIIERNRMDQSLNTLQSTVNA